MKGLKIYALDDMKNKWEYCTKTLLFQKETEVSNMLDLFSAPLI